MKENTINKVEETVNVLCEWIQNEAKKTPGNESVILPEVVKSLAILVNVIPYRL